MLGSKIQELRGERATAVEAWVNYFLPDLGKRMMWRLQSLLGLDLYEFRKLSDEARAIKVPVLKRLLGKGSECRLQRFSSEFKDLRERLAIFIENDEKNRSLENIRKLSRMINQLEARKDDLNKKIEAFIDQLHLIHSIREGIATSAEDNVPDELSHELELAIERVLPIVREMERQIDAYTPEVMAFL